MKAQPNILLESLSGKICSNSDMSIRHRKTGLSAYRWNRNTVIKPTAARLAQRQLLKLATQAASAILSDPLQRAKWQKSFSKQHKYAYLYGFIISAQMKLIKNALCQEPPIN